MAAVDGLSNTLDELDDMEAKLCLHHIGDFAIAEVEGNRFKLWGPDTLTCQAELAALTRRTWVFGIEHRHGGETALTFKDALADLVEAVFHL